MSKIRDKFFLFLFKISEDFYRTYFKKHASAWRVTLDDLEKMPGNTIGYNYFCFLSKNKFNILPKLESHDMFHALTSTDTKVIDELSLQFYLFGNGKKSLYQYCVLISSILFIDKSQIFIEAFRNGKKARPFSHLDFQNYLHHDLSNFKHKYKIQKIYDS